MQILPLTECNLPLHLKPNDSSILKYVKKKANRVKCNENKAAKYYYKIDGSGRSLTYVDKNGVLITSKKLSNVKCFYRTFDRKGTSDNYLQFGRFRPLPPKLDLNELSADFVSVECRKFKKFIVYKNNHFYPSTVRRVKREEENDERISVVILVLESLSRLNYLRFMQQTKQALESMGNIFYLEGLTKLADNSFPNMTPFLTGLRARPNEFPNNISYNGPYDELPFLWKDFAAKGYKTSLIEEHPKITLYNYLARGFLHKPVDWYPRPYWIRVFQENTRRRDFCYNYQPLVEIFLEQKKQFLRKMKSSPIFMFSFYIEVTHNDFNNVQLIDSHYANFIQEFKDQLNSTIFILMGDHGNRYGAVLETFIGKVESRMPLFAMHLPEKLLQKHSHLKHFLELNKQRLTTWLDVHRTLLDVAAANYSIIRDKSKSRSYSVWRQAVPLDRNCAEALIPESYCVCDQREELNVSDAKVQKAAEVLVLKLNAILKQEKKCKKLFLHEIKSCSLIYHSHALINKEKQSERRYELVIDVKPSNAVFRGQVIEKSGEWEQRTEISRINAYKDQSYCVNDRFLKKFCFC
ncbi:uncharacterized protein B4U79_10917 [Dinothrombium tinctorium]|uniref:Uncharacterized protein n=1 Tax=Dinothrombium tinctorium TaxID=1965070 RepID=A0A3S4R5N7_9ACAR|nr:uncharacterized protein B4U79_09644 [Dinothrombium tinctorium]RWS11903.1 uncharacterized protein B4U79_02454 [Dinothrombium tinctorium]RWS13880.1 uncharacterized protein B4U79_10917 [Dinothrombium tinctorium]